MCLHRLIFGLLCVGLCSGLVVQAKPSTWKDLQGESFRAEPAEVLGPFALFKSGRSGKRVLLRGLSPEDCVRFQAQITAEPGPAEYSVLTRELMGRVVRPEGGRLVPVDLATRPDPRVYLVLFGSHNDGESWRTIHDLTPTYHRLRQLYPGQVEAVFVGIRHKADEHRRIATDTHMPWLVADYESQETLREITRYTPAEGISLVALSSAGVPLLSTPAQNVSALRKFIDELGEFMQVVQPSDPRTWKDQQHYLTAVQRTIHAADSVGPVLVGDPLRADGLRQRGITRVQASAEVAADGSVTSVTVVRADGVTDETARALSAALRQQSLFIPAVERGAWVAATYDYDRTVPPADAELAAAEAWLGGTLRTEVRLPDWLLLKPIRVPQQDIMAGSEVRADQTVVLRPVQALEGRSGEVDRASQRSAFMTDWFSADGAGGATSVRPVEGAKLTIDEQEVAWKKAKAVEGLVNLQDGFGQAEYSIGYAWAEFEVPADADAWLGLGSDDGVKIWLNGAPVYDKWIRRLSRLDDDVVPLSLKAGKNQLLIKIQNVSGDWSFRVRLRTK